MKKVGWDDENKVVKCNQPACLIIERKSVPVSRMGSAVTVTWPRAR